MAEYNYENVKVEVRDGIGWAIKNRPEKRNAMSPQLHHDMDDALALLETDPDTKIVVITGAGNSFCAGQDLKLYFRGLSNDPVAKARASHYDQTSHSTAEQSNDRSHQPNRPCQPR